MITITTSGGLPADFTREISEIDPAVLDRWADVLVSQGYARQGERLGEAVPPDRPGGDGQA
jgi:hypothetical protein